MALVAFAIYAAVLASRAGEVTEAVPITVPSGGQSGVSVAGGVPAPDFMLTDLNGQSVSLSSVAGRPVWINVWATWCAPCRAEMPDIDTVYQDLRAKNGSDLALLMVSLGEDPGAVRKYVDSTRYDLPILLDPEFALTERYRITGLPTHYFIARDGTIKDLHIGPLKPNVMRSMLAKITA